MDPILQSIINSHEDLGFVNIAEFKSKKIPRHTKLTLRWKSEDGSQAFYDDCLEKVFSYVCPENQYLMLRNEKDN